MSTRRQPRPQQSTRVVRSPSRGRTRPPREAVLLDRQVQAINRFPDQNPNPVMRMSNDGFLLYANVSSAPIRRAWGVEIGDPLPDDVVSGLRAAINQPAEKAVHVEHENRTYSVLAVDVPDLGFVNLYGTDVTAQRVIDKFPDQNPNPVLRVSRGRLLYANRASRPIVEAEHLVFDRPIPRAIQAQIDACLIGRRRDPIEVVAGDKVFELLPVAVPEFGFTNLYGTDVTAVRMIAEANRENERLLLNILPSAIAERLRRGERVIADRFDDATLLIADIVGFTALSSGLAAIDVVRLLNGIFSACDALVEKHGLEKVKTIGDAYMVVGGVPTYVEDHLERVADLALELASEVDSMQQGMPRRVSVRIGIHSGPLAAGVIGVKKFIYDVWGDTVNQAARMEALSAPGRIHVTQQVHDRLADRYAFEPRGVIDVKGKGAMATWFLVGRL